MGLAKNSLVNYFGQMISLVFSATSVIIVTRILGASGKGAYTLIVLLPYVVSLVGNLGIAHASVYFLGRGKNPESLVANQLFIATVSGVISSTVMTVGLVYYHSILFKNIPLPYLMVALWTTPLLILILFFAFTLLARDIFRYNLVCIFQNGLNLFFIFILVSIFRQGLNGAVASYLISTIITAILAYVFVQKYIQLNIRLIDLKLLLEELRFGIKAYLFYLAQYLNYRLDTLIVAYYLPLAQVGFYSIAVALAEVVTKLPNSAALAIFPALAASNDIERSRVTAKACRTTIFLVLASLIILTIVGRKLIVVLFGPSFTPVLVPLLLLFPGMIAISIYKIILYDLTARGQPESGAFASLISLVVTVALDIGLIPIMGITGAAIASSVAYSISAIMLVYMFLKTSNMKFSDVIILRERDIIESIAFINRLKLKRFWRVNASNIFRRY